MLLRSILARFESAIAHTEAHVSRYRSVARLAPAFDPESIPARRRFLAKRVKLLQNLMRWRKHTGERFGIGSLATRLVDSCVVDFAQDGWEVGGDEFARRVRIVYSSNVSDENNIVLLGCFYRIDRTVTAQVKGHIGTRVRITDL
jgi:GC-rich sequence DNA-binding factor